MANARSENKVTILTAGGFRLLDADGTETQINLGKGAAIIAYLLFSHSPHATRDKLAGLLWSESSNSAARTSLRQCLHQLRSLLSNVKPQILQITTSSISLMRDSIVTDLDMIDPAAGASLTNLPASVPDPHRLLDGFDDLDPSFREWLTGWRAAVELKLRSRLVNSIKSSEVAHDARLQAAEALNELDPTDEVAARYLIQEEARNNNVSGMLRIYRQLWDALDEEWGEEPSMDLQNFVADLRLNFGKTDNDNHPGKTEGTFQGFKKRRSFVTIIVVRILLPNAAHQIDPEEFGAIMKSHVLKVNEILIKHRGIVSKNIGNDIIGIFGHPNAAEEDAFNALRAALDLREALQNSQERTPPALQETVKIGLDSGLVFLQQSGEDGSLSDLLGTPVDKAMELVRRDGASSILATERSFRRLISRFAVTEETPLVEDDRSESVISVHAHKGEPDAPHIDTFLAGEEIVGRQHHLAKLSAAWSKSRRSGLQIVSVVGDPGIGKTRLVTEFLHRRPEAAHCSHFVRCNRIDQSAPLDPMHALELSIRSRVIQNTEASPTAGKLSGEPIPAGSMKTEVAAQSDRLFHDITRGLFGENTIIIFDDWQWADDASRLMLTNMVQHLKEHPILLILTTRDNQLYDPVLAEALPISLSNLTEDEVSEVSIQLLGWQPEDRIRDFLFDKSGGNPLFLEEICRAIAYQPLAYDPNGLVDQLPGSLQALIVSRVERLNPFLRTVVEAAAVSGESVSIKLLGQVLDMQMDAETILQLEETKLLSATPSTDMVRFKHGITRDVVYGTIDLNARRELHARFACVLESETDPDQLDAIVERLALHCRGAGDYENGAVYAERAGDKAIAASSLDLAKSQFAAAMNMIDQCEPSADNRRRWLSVVLRWGIPCVYAPSREQLPVLSRASLVAQEFEDISSMAVVNYWIGYITHVLGDHTDAIQQLSFAKELATKAGNERVAAEVMATRGFAFAAKCEYVHAQKDIEYAIEAKDKNPGHKSRTPVLSSYARATLAVIKADQGHFEEGNGLILEALDRVRGSSHEIESSICNMGSAILLWRGDWADAKKLATRSRRRSEAVNSPYLIGMARCLLGYASWRDTGDPDAVEMLYSAAERLWSAEMRLYNSFSFGWVADASIGLGRLSEAHDAAVRTLDLAEQGDPMGAAMACRTLAMLATKDSSNGLELALDHLNKAETFAKQRNSPHEHAINLLHFARVHAAFGHLNPANEYLTNAVPVLSKLGMNWHLDRAKLLAGKLRAFSSESSQSRIAEFAL